GGAAVRMRALGLLLLLAACAPPIVERPAPEAAGAPGGGRGRFHRFRVRVTAAPAEIRHDLTLKEIALLPGAAGRGLKTQGVTTIRHSLATHTRFSTTTGTRAVYAWFDDVILEISISSIIIHIPREYAPGSCEYRIVLEHERGHGRSAREQAVDLAGKLEHALASSEGIPTRFDPVISTDFAAAGDQLKAAIAKVVDPVYEQYEKDEAQTQARLDSPDPYAAVYDKCGGWK
ncbi:MAG: hypothetical protein PHS14_21325, partial [Elusimicrobia bacterium]|nr:hypothetical protein [Elusimicrobiota bacterium]